MRLIILFLILFLFIPINASTVRNDGAYKLLINLDGSLQNPSFSPDGKLIIFTNFRNGYNNGPADLYTYNLETETLHLLVKDGSDNVNLPGHIWINNTIVFSSSRDPHDEIFRIDENGSPGDEIQITKRDNLVAYEPSFSKNGNYIAFESHELDKDNDGVIMKYRTDGIGEYVALTNKDINAKQPNFSPTYNIISYQKKTDGQWDIWIVNDDGTNNHQLTYGSGSKTDASYSPDGQWIIYSKEIQDTDAANIFRISINGTVTEQLTTYSGYDGAASLYKSQIVFESCAEDPDNSDGTSLWIRDIRKKLVSSYNIDEDRMSFYFPFREIIALMIVSKIIKRIILRVK